MSGRVDGCEGALERFARDVVRFDTPAEGVDVSLCHRCIHVTTQLLVQPGQGELDGIARMLRLLGSEAQSGPLEQQTQPIQCRPVVVAERCEEGDPL